MGSFPKTYIDPPGINIGSPCIRASRGESLILDLTLV